MSLIFNFLEIFVFLLFMQSLRLNGCWGDSSTPIILLDNNENYAFIGIKGSYFWRFAPWHWKLKEGKKTRSQAFLKIMKIEAESLFVIQQ